MSLESDTNPAGSQPAANPGNARPSQIAAAAMPVMPVEYLSDKLKEAELLLGYAAEVGIEVEKTVQDGVLKARAARDGGGMTEETAAGLLTALTALAVKVKPATVQSLRACAHPREARAAVRLHGWIVGAVAALIVPCSVLIFVTNSISQKITTDVEAANVLAIKLRVGLGPVVVTTNLSPAANSTPDEVWFGASAPPRGLTDKEVVSDLQQFAGSIREIDGYARQLNLLVLNMERVPYHDHRTNYSWMREKFELKPGLWIGLNQEFSEKAEVYQQIRYFGNSVQERVTVYYGAIATCILPVLYALLGAGAYLLRSFEDQIKSRTFTTGDRHAARYLIAGIGGMVVGLFNVSQSAAMQPFALAFLVGYAVDVFFAFLEGLLQIFKRGSGNAATRGKTS